MAEQSLDTVAEISFLADIYGNGCTTTLPLEVFTHRNYVADFIRLKLTFIPKERKIAFEPPFRDSGVMYAFHL